MSSSILGRLAAVFKTPVLSPHFVLLLVLSPGAQNFGFQNFPPGPACPRQALPCAPSSLSLKFPFAQVLISVHVLGKGLSLTALCKKKKKCICVSSNASILTKG